MFSPADVKTFRFVSWRFDEADFIAYFDYAFDDDVYFTETYQFPKPAEPLSAERKTALDKTLFLLSLVAGVSYYKAAVPHTAVIESGRPTDAQVAFLHDIYVNGLGEFSYENNLSLQHGIDFQYESTASNTGLAQLHLQRRSLVAIGGGKDSCVSVEILRAANEPMLLGSINTPRAILDTAAVSGFEHVFAKRSLSPELTRINGEGAYNGHVPITAIVSLALVALAIINDCDSVVMSNERSASFGNLFYDGREINHQYSKSLIAEQQIADLIATSISPQINYFSLLRPLSELAIARRFAETDRYDRVFVSCNRAFKLDPSARSDRWCGNCDKCRFVFLALATAMTPQRLFDIFNADLLQDITQSEGFDALIGYNAFKPFECVGEVEESIAAFLMLMQSQDWRDHALVQRFAQQILPKLDLPADVVERPLVVGKSHRLTSRYVEML